MLIKSWWEVIWVFPWTDEKPRRVLRGLGKSPLDTFNPVDKILFMGIQYQRAEVENGSHVSTKCSFGNVLISCYERRNIVWLWQPFLVMLSTCLSNWERNPLKYLSPESYRSFSVRGRWRGTRTNLNFFCSQPMRKPDISGASWYCHLSLHSDVLSS